MTMNIPRIVGKSWALEIAYGMSSSQQISRVFRNGQVSSSNIVFDYEKYLHKEKVDRVMRYNHVRAVYDEMIFIGERDLDRINKVFEDELKKKCFDFKPYKSTDIFQEPQHMRVLPKERKYILDGDMITARDGDHHKIPSVRLLQLYQLNSWECVIVRDGQHRKYCKEALETKGLIWLGPRSEGDYEEHLHKITASQVFGKLGD